MGRDYDNMTMDELLEIIEQQDFMIACYEAEEDLTIEPNHASRCSYWLWLSDPDNHEYCDCLLRSQNK